MRPSTLLGAVVAAFSPLCLAAQASFEGVVTTTVAAFHGHALTTWVKGARFRSEMPSPDGGAMTMIGDEHGRILMLIDEEKKYYAMPAGGLARAGGGATPTVTPAGRSETVAGYPCRYYHLHRASGTPADEELCVTTALGYVEAAQGPGMDSRFIQRTWPDGFLVLKSVDARGKVQSEVTRIQRTAVSDAQLSPPAGYTELKMPGFAGLGGRPRP